MAVTISTNYILKTLWPQRRVENLVYKDHPFLAMVPKDETFFGENLVLAVRYADTQGRGAAFSTAQAQIGAHKGVRFYLTRVKDYQLASLETEAILATQNDEGALIRNLDTEIESALNNISKSLAMSLYGNGLGSLAQVAAAGGTLNSATGNIPLAIIDQITNFEVGMVLQAASADGGAVRAGTMTVSAVDRDAGIVYGNTNGITGLANSDFIGANSDMANGGAKVRITGLQGWLPSSAPTTGDSFFQVDRSVDPTRLAGLRVDVSALNPEEGMITLLSKQSREGGNPKYVFMNHLDFRNVEISLGSKVEYETFQLGDIGFSGVNIRGPKGVVALMADQDCPARTAFSIDPSSVKLYSLKKAPQILDLDGNKLSRTPTADQWELRIAYFAQLGFTAPGWNARVTMPS